MDLKKIYFIICLCAVFYCSTLMSATSFPLVSALYTSKIREYKINNLKQQNNIIISNIVREIVIAKKTIVDSFNRFSLEDNNCGANLYFKEGWEKKTNYMWRNYCLDASVKYNIYKKCLLISCTYNNLDFNIHNSLNETVAYSQKSKNFAVSEISTYEYIDSICTVFINSTSHRFSNYKDLNTNMYGVAYTFNFNFNFDVDLFIAQFMLTTRYLYIDTSIDAIETNNNDRLHLISVGPVITMQKDYTLIEECKATVGFEVGYLRTINTNTDTYIRVVSSIWDKISNNIKAQNDWYFLGSISLRRNNIILGIEITCDHDKYKKLYGASSYIKFRF